MNKVFAAKRFYIIAAVLFCVCGAVPVFSQAPQLGEPTLLQQELNRLPAVPIGSNNLRFQFGGSTWIANNNGRNFLAGTVTFYDTDEGSYLILNQTHVYLRLAWISTSGPEIILEYIAGPPASFRMISRSALPPGLAPMEESAPPAAVASVQAPVVEPTPEPVASVQAPVVEQAPQPVASVQAPVVEPMPEPAASVQAPVAEPTPEPVASVQAPAAEPTPEPAASVQAPAAEPTPEPAAPAKPSQGSILVTFGFGGQSLFMDREDYRKYDHYGDSITPTYNETVADGATAGVNVLFIGRSGFTISAGIDITWNLDAGINIDPVFGLGYVYKRQWYAGVLLNFIVKPYFYDEREDEWGYLDWFYTDAFLAPTFVAGYDFGGFLLGGQLSYMYGYISGIAGFRFSLGVGVSIR